MLQIQLAFAQLACHESLRSHDVHAAPNAFTQIVCGENFDKLTVVGADE